MFASCAFWGHLSAELQWSELRSLELPMGDTCRVIKTQGSREDGRELPFRSPLSIGDLFHHSSFLSWVDFPHLQTD